MYIHTYIHTYIYIYTHTHFCGFYMYACMYVRMIYTHNPFSGIRRIREPPRKQPAKSCWVTSLWVISGFHSTPSRPTSPRNDRQCGWRDHRERHGVHNESLFCEPLLQTLPCPEAKPILHPGLQRCWLNSAKLPQRHETLKPYDL